MLLEVIVMYVVHLLVRVRVQNHTLLVSMDMRWSESKRMAELVKSANDAGNRQARHETRQDYILCRFLFIGGESKLATGLGVGLMAKCKGRSKRDDRPACTALGHWAV